MAEILRGGRYTIVRVLGEGAQGSTFEATDHRDGKVVAVKRFAVRSAKAWKEVELAEREARVLASLAHPKLPAYVEHFEENGALYLVMERIAGVSLAEYRRRGAVFREDDAVRLLEEVSEVLAYLHSRTPPIIHRDLKPGNVIRRPDGTYAFVDFGAVRDRLRQGGGSTIVGTFGYMAPEQFQGRALPQSDVYAVGATVLWMLAGEEPEDLPHKGLKIDVAAALGKRASPTLVTILSRMLEPDPDARPVSIAPFLAGFGVRGEEVRRDPVTGRDPAPPAPARSGLPASFLALTSPAEDPLIRTLFGILRRFMPFFWILSAFAWWWLPWTMAMTFSVGLAILSLATSEYAPGPGEELGKRARRPRVAREIRVAEIDEPRARQRLDAEGAALDERDPEPSRESSRLGGSGP